MIVNKFELEYMPKAELQLLILRNDSSKKAIFKAVYKALTFMGSNLKHSSLHTHKYDEMIGPNGEEVFESYAQNNTPGAYRIFWFYGPVRNKITILAITPHP